MFGKNVSKPVFLPIFRRTDAHCRPEALAEVVLIAETAAIGDFLHRKVAVTQQRHGTVHACLVDKLLGRYAQQTLQFAVQSRLADVQLGCQLGHTEVGVVDVLFHKLHHALHEALVFLAQALLANAAAVGLQGLLNIGNSRFLCHCLRSCRFYGCLFRCGLFRCGLFLSNLG